MEKHENRREFLQKLGALSLVTGLDYMTPTKKIKNAVKEDLQDEALRLKSLPPTEIFSVLDLTKPGMAAVKTALERKGHDAGLEALLKYYRDRYPKQIRSSVKSERENDSVSFERADNLGKHIFQWGPYESANYGPDINWAADPAGDIEWVAAIYRFYWASDLGNSYLVTGNESYAGIFVDLASDWIRKHPLEKTINIKHPVYGWNGYPWLDLQTGIRATNICSNFRQLVHAKSFTPRFLGLLLASLYDHQVKTERMPMGKIHNKAIFEQRGFFNVIHTFQEFKDNDRWLETAIGITYENLLAQTTTDGVQKEWCGGYHSGVYRDALEIDGRVRDLGRNMPVQYVDRVRAMADHIFGISTPDLGFPMFGDTGRGKRRSTERRTWQLSGILAEATRRFEDPKYQALVDLNISLLPRNGSIAFSEAGLYALRNGWSADQVYMAFHCSPPAISSHDTPDNGTFELYAYGRWLMPDTGFYTYGHDPEARAWHRQTKVHSTLTLNGRDTNINARQLLWHSDEDEDIVCVENQSYQYFLHRRTIWFTGKKSKLPFFVILDEAYSDIKGDYELHFPMAPGDIIIDYQTQSITTSFEDANLMILVEGKKPVSLLEEKGWTAREYGDREPRTTVTAVYNGKGPFTFVSLLVPYSGKSNPACRILSEPSTFVAGRNPLDVRVEVEGNIYNLRRKIIV